MKFGWKLILRCIMHLMLFLLHFAHPFQFTKSSYNASIYENAIGKTYVMSTEKMGMFSEDIGQDVRYKIISGDEDRFFKAESRLIGDFYFLNIRTRTGNSEVLNRERKDKYRLMIRAILKSPAGSQSSRSGRRDSRRDFRNFTIVVVSVLDTNDLNPLFYHKEYDVTVPEDTPLQKTFITLNAFDSDEGMNSEIYYSLLESTLQFAIHPTEGSVFLTRPLAFSRRQYYELTIVAQDRGAKFRIGDVAGQMTAVIRISVVQVNFYSPVIKIQHHSSLIENSMVRVYAIMKIVDKDEGIHGEIKSVDIVDGDPSGYFKIVPAKKKSDEYNIVLQKSMDRESSPHGMNLSIVAIDRGVPPKQTTEHVIVRVTDLNDHAPVFLQKEYLVDVEEIVPINTPLIIVNASDTDIGKNAEIIYDITNGNAMGMFNINHETGLISTRRKLDAEEVEKFTLTVSAQDQATYSMRKQGVAFVKIRVKDSNDNDPLFDRSSDIVTLNENEPVGKVVYTAKASDIDSGDNGFITYSIANINSVPFQIDQLTGKVSTTEILDYETAKREYVIKIRASDWGKPSSRQVEMVLKIRLQDINDHRPQFQKLNCKGYLSRRALIGTEIITVSAIDFDVGNIITYKIMSNNYEGCFKIDKSTGVITLNCKLSETSFKDFVINVTATDGEHFADVILSIKVKVLTNRKNKHLMNKDAVFECQDVGVTKKYEKIMSAAKANNQLGDHNLLSDMPSNPVQNSHSPRFVTLHPKELHINESISIGTVLYKFLAQDRDLGYNGQVVYVISSGNEDSCFKVDTHSGELVVMARVDYELRKVYNLNVTAFDLGVPQRDTSVTIKIVVEDVNDNAPQFEKPSYRLHIPEDFPKGTSVKKLQAYDSDSGSNSDTTYSLMTDTKNAFTIDKFTGVLTVNDNLDREVMPRYELKIKADNLASHDGNIFSIATVEIFITDINDNPPKFNVPVHNIRIREDIPVGTVAVTVNAIDPDENQGGIVTYKMVSGGGDQTFQIDKKTGTLRLMKPLDFESRQIYNITIEARDGGIPSLKSRCYVIIEVIDINENLHAPKFSTFATTGSVREGLPVGTFVMQVSANDEDIDIENSQISYSIRDQGGNVGIFSIDDKGNIHTLQVLDRETTKRYWLTIIAQDRAVKPLLARIEVYIEILDENDNIPQTDEPIYYTSIPENSPSQTTVLTVVATDLDNNVNQKLIYKIKSGNPQGFFVINELTGLISTTDRKLDREFQEEHVLEISITDNGHPPLSSTTRVIVSVVDVNDNKPVFLQRLFRVRLPEMAASDTEKYLYHVIAKDADSGMNAEIEYAILQTEDNSRFRIDSETGVIYSRHAFKSGEKFELSVKASDKGLPRFSSTARVLINIMEIPKSSPNPPIVSNDHQHIKVFENERIGQMVALIDAQDDDNDQLWFSIIPNNSTNDFMIQPHMGDILIANRLDVEKVPQYDLTISVTDGINVVNTKLYIEIVDVNDHRPQFSRRIYYSNVTENAVIGTEVIQLTASDQDKDKRLVFAIHSCANPASLKKFSIDTTKGIITTNDLLDHEIMKTHHLTIVVKDFGTPSLRNYAKVNINILDHNDHAPDFMIPMFKTQIHETAGVGTVVIPIKAIDRDKGRNAVIRYSIVSGNIGSVFSINSVSGEIRVMKKLDKRTMSEYILIAKASDQGAPPLSTTVPVQIIISIADDAPPRFEKTNYATEIHENQIFGAFVIHISASSKSTVFFSITDGNINETFYLDNNSGVMTVNKQLDYETNNLYNLTVKATNLMGKSSFCNVLVHILDLNDNSPYFLSKEYNGSILESSAIGGVVIGDNDTPLVVSAIDDDSDMNSVLTYNIIGTDAKQYFSIDSNSGAIRTIRLLDREKISEFEFRVQVWDSGIPRLTSETSSLVHIEILDVNDCPPKFERNDYNSTLLLPTYRDVTILEVKAKDCDSLAITSLVYSIIEGNDERNFDIEPKSGILSVKEEDRLKKSYNLIINVSDGKFSATTRALINVKQTSKSSFVFAKDVYVANIEENHTEITTVAMLTVLGNSLSDDVKYYILNPNSKFAIGSTSGVIKTTGVPFDREDQGTYTLVVEARSRISFNDFQIAHVLVHVSVMDVNDNAPMFMNLPYYSPVALEAKKGDFIQKIEAIDLDIGINGEITYQLVRGHEGKFRINSRTGEIFLHRRLQHEQHNKEFKIIVAAVDKGDDPLRTETEVSVRVINKNMPVFAQQFYAVSIPENLKAQSPVLSIMANSPQNRKLIYSIVAGDIYEEFSVDYDTGVIHSIDKLDHETKSKYSLTLRATDAVIGTYAEVPVIITVTDINDNPPQFLNSTYNISVPESVPFGSSIYRIFAEDKDTDLNGRIQYSLKGNASFLFHVNPSIGSIFIKKKLDYEQTSLYHFTVVASDMGTPSLSSEVQVWVYVRDVNDNPPTFEHQSYYCHLSENAQRNQFITKVFASDPDVSDHSKLYYAIVGGNSQQSFSINSQSGIIRLTNLHKFTQLPSYTLNISVSDGVFTSYTRVIIKLLGVNSHTPQFSRSIYDVIIQEDAPVGKTIFTAAAKDPDRGEFGEVSYDLQSDASRKMFTINSETGVIKLRHPLDREESYMHEVPVVAVDKGGRTGYTLLRVAVGDINDNVPQFQANEYKASIHANMSVGTTILTVRAFDKDQGLAGTIEYSLYEGDIESRVAEKFGISTSTGEIYLISSVSSLQNRVYQFFVRAQDKGSPRLEMDVPIDIIVMSPDDIAPRFEQQIYEYFAREDSPFGTTITTLRAISKDTVTYSLVPPSNSEDDDEDIEMKFEVNPLGRVTVSGTLDREEVNVYTLTVKASTKSSPPLVAFAEIIIQIMDNNDNPPIFESDPYRVTVAENAEEGLTVLKVVAKDRDAGNHQEISYSFAKGSEFASNTFSLDPKSGWISTFTKLDRESVQNYTFGIIAQDNGSPRLSSTTTVIVEVKDYNDNPPIFTRQRYVTAVNEDALPGTVIITVDTEDADSAESSEVPVEYFISNGDSHGQFAVRQTGEVYVSKSLDRELVSHYEIEITATDGTFVAQTKLSIGILDANDNAPVCHKSRYKEIFSESINPGSYVLTIEASDADEGRNAELIYKLKGQGTDYFTIDKHQGFIKVAQSLDREELSNFHMTAIVQDSLKEEWFCTSEIEILVNDVNDNSPVFSQEIYSVSVPEDIEPQMLITKVHAQDKDIGINRKISYSLLDSSKNHFAIDEDSGIIMVKKPLDRENTARYNLTVQATDSGVPNLSSVCIVMVIVTDVNDNHPEFAHKYYFASVSERSVSGTAVIRLLATSRDIGANADITYSILAGNNDDEFSIHPKYGVISVKKPLDYERIREYFLLIQAQDGGNPPLHNHAKVNISITDANDNPPIFNLKSYTAVIPENAIAGDKVIQTVAGDLDSGINAKISYHIVRGDPLAQFSIDPDTGDITVVSELDREATSKYSLEVQAHDKGLPTMSSSVLVDIEITDINDNPPQFSQSNYSVVLQENKPKGSIVVQFIVRDADEDPNGAPFSFEIISGNEDNDFRVGSNGELITTAKFKRKHHTDYQLQIKCYDNGAPSLSSTTNVHLRIIEESKYPPIAKPLSTEVSSYLDHFPGGRIGKIIASDQDPYDVLSYRMISNHAHLFTVNPEDGTIFALEGLDVGLYKMNVSVYDGKFITFTTVKVDVSLITNDMLKNAVAIRILKLTPEQFVLSHRQRFIRSIKNIFSVRMKDVNIISIQPAFNDGGKQKRQARQDLDVLIAIRKDQALFYGPNKVRKTLNDNIRRLKSATKLEILEIVEDRCSTTTCNHGQCIDKLILDESVVISVTTNDASYVSPQHHQRLECDCDPGYGGEFCEIAVNECANNPCPEHRKCIPDSSPLGFKCICPPGKTGARCDKDAASCHGPSCHIERNPMSFSGKSYAKYALFTNIERHLTLSMYVRTVQLTGCLMFASGQVDYGILEVVNGQVQYKFDCGTGEGLVRVEHIFINDGNWHEIKLERHGNIAELIVDQQYRGSGSAPGHNDVLNIANNEIWFGAEVQPHPTINHFDDIRMGFYGCMDSIKIDHNPLPLVVTGSNSIATLKRLKNVENQCYETLDPGVCGSQPCFNGGTCTASDDGKSYTCNCHYGYIGLRCETNTNPCASNPCLYGGICHELSNDYRCECKEGLSRKRCEYGRYCNPNPCQNGGICEEGTDSAICKCKGFQGEYCTMDVNECLHNPCQNGGTCINVLGSFDCLCTPNTTGHLCMQYVTTPNIKSDSSNIYFDEKIGLVLCVVITILVVVIFVISIKKLRKNQRHRRNNEAVEMTSNEIIKNKTNENSNRISKMSNLEASYPGPPSRRARPASYTPSTHDSYIAMNNFDTVRSYGSAADDLENIPRYSQDFMQSICKPSNQAQLANDVDCDDICKPCGASWDANLKDSYPEDKMQNDLRQKKHVPDIPPPLQALNNMTLHPVATSSLSGASENEDLPGGKKMDNKGYHWDCSDWVRSQNPLPNITEVSMQEVSDSPSVHSNESNTHIDAALPLLDGSNNSRPKIEGALNPNIRVGSDPSPGESSRLLDPVTEFDDSDVDEDSPHSTGIFPSQPNFENILNDLEMADGNNSYQPSNLNYQLHPDNYLPSYNIVGNSSQNLPSQVNPKEDNKYSLPRRRRHAKLDDLASNRFSIGGYSSANGSCSDVSQNLCEIEDSEVNYSDSDEDDNHVLMDTKL